MFRSVVLVDAMLLSVDIMAPCMYKEEVAIIFSIGDYERESW